MLKEINPAVNGENSQSEPSLKIASLISITRDCGCSICGTKTGSDDHLAGYTS